MAGWPGNLLLGILRLKNNASRRISLNHDARVSYQRGFSGSCCAMRASRESTANDHGQWKYPIFASERLTERQSVFMAHASTLPTSEALDTFISNLVSLPTLKKATHCMYAYRIVPDLANPSAKVTGQNDGGERGSGELLKRLLEKMECENVVVVVSRWYGGVKIGSHRWRIISTVAKEALRKGDFVKRKDVKSTLSKKK